MNVVEPHPGLSAPSEPTQSRRRPDETVLLVLSGSGAISIFPFSIYRALQADWPIAAMDFAASLLMMVLFGYVYRTRETALPKLVLSAVFLVATNLTVFLKGATQIYWCYPATVAVFYLVPLRQAAILVSIAVLAILMMLVTRLEILELVTIAITLIATNIFAYVFAVRSNEQNQRLMVLATHDPLTGAGNRRALEEKLGEIVRLQQRRQYPVSLIMLDLDYFKRVNDSFGHAVGDDVLQRFADLIRARIRVTDSFFRFGGEEFVIIAEDANLQAAVELAEALRRGVAASELIPGHSISMSVGVAEHREGDDRDSWSGRADQALLAAKQGGRNRVCAATA